MARRCSLLIRGLDHYKCRSAGGEVGTDAAASATKQYINEGEVSLENVALDAAAGQLIDRPVRNIVRGRLQTSQEAKTLHRQADRARRVARGENPRESRRTRAEQATQRAEDYGTGRAAATGTASSNAASTAVRNSTTEDENQ